MPFVRNCKWSGGIQSCLSSKTRKPQGPDLLGSQIASTKLQFNTSNCYITLVGVLQMIKKKQKNCVIDTRSKHGGAGCIYVHEGFACYHHGEFGERSYIHFASLSARSKTVGAPYNSCKHVPVNNLYIYSKSLL